MSFSVSYLLLYQLDLSPTYTYPFVRSNAHNFSINRRQLWNDLIVATNDSLDSLMIMLSDFNAIYDPSEKLKGIINQNP